MHKGLAAAASQVQRAGQGPDKMLAHIAPEEAQFLNYVQGGPNINPQTGLPQYGLFGKVLKGLARAAGAVVGFMYGGPAGAALGSAAATKLTGGSWKQSAIAGGLAGLGGWAGNLATGAGTGLTTGASLGPFAGASTGAAASGITGTIPGIASSAPSGFVSAAPGALASSAPLTLSGVLNTATSIPGSLATLGGSLGGAETRGANAGKPPEGFPEKRDDVTMDQIRERLKAAGFDPNRVTIAPTGNQYRYGFGPEQKMFRGSGYAAGGQVRGLGRAVMQGAMRRGGPVQGGTAAPGKDDNIPAMLSENEHVWAAQDVADLGDGNSDAGHRRMEEIKRMVREGAGRKNPRKTSGKQKGLGAIVERAKKAA